MKDIMVLLKKLRRLLYVQAMIKMESIRSVETYAYGTSKDLVS